MLKRPPWLLNVLWVLGIGTAAVVMLGLGVWQLSRLQERRDQNAEIRAHLAQPPLVLTGQSLANPVLADPQTLEYRSVSVRGVYDFAHEVVLRNRAYQGSPGVHVLTPLKIAGSDAAVMVDRGWIPYTEAALEARAVYQASTGEVEVTGLLRPSQTRASPLLPADPTPGPGTARLDAWYWADLTQMQAQMPYPLLPVLVEAAPGRGAALPISGSELELEDGPHLSYAIQWFAFAAILVFGSLAFARQQRRQAKPH